MDARELIPPTFVFEHARRTDVTPVLLNLYRDGEDGDVAEWTVDVPGAVAAHAKVWTNLRTASSRVEVAARVAGAAGFDLAVFSGHVYVLRGLVQDEVVGDPAFDDRFLIKTNGPDLLPIWLDAPIRDAMTAAWDPRRNGAARLEIVKGAASVRAQLYDGDTATFGAMCRLVDAIGSRPARLAAEWSALAADLGGAAPTSGWPLERDHALTFARPAGEATVALRFAPTEAGGRAPWLRTEVRARRGALAALELALWRDDVARSRRPRLDAGDAVTAPIAAFAFHGTASDPPAAKRRVLAVHRMLAAARPTAIVATRSEVTIVLPGLVLDRGRVGAAIDAAIELTRDADGPRDTGPYR